METPSSISTDTMHRLSSRLAYFGKDFPSDNLTDLFRRLHRWSKDKRHAHLALLLEETIAVIREEVEKLPKPVPEQVTGLQNIGSLVDGFEAIRTTPIGGALEGSLLVVLQIAALIGHYEAHGQVYDFTETATTLSGLSLGLLSAAAVAVSTSIPDLIRYGVEGARIAFRMGIHVDHVSQGLEPRDADGPPKSWAYVVANVGAETVQQELDRFNRDTQNPELTKVFISAADAGSVSVTGPPSRLHNAFHYSSVLRYSKHIALPVYNGLCHAPHVFSEKDSSTIVSIPKDKASRTVSIPLLSQLSGRPYAATQLKDLFEEIVFEILTGNIYLDNVTAGIVRDLAVIASPETEVFGLRTSPIAEGFLSAIKSHLPEVNIKKHDLVDWIVKEEPSFFPDAPRSYKQSKLAIVGASCRIPGGGEDMELFWKILEEARDVHTTVPADRFDIDAHFDAEGKVPNTTATGFGNFLNNPGMFDANFFNMSPREAEQTDPMHRLALVTVYEALEQAGYAPNRTPSTNLQRIGTWYGMASDDWREFQASQNIGTYAVPGTERAFANGRVNYFFKFGGPSFSTDTACSSGLAAVNQACSALWAGECDTAIAGGLNVISGPDNFAMLCRGHFLSKTGQCKVWDKDADGYCRADGIGSVIIKRLEDAVADNDNIIACVDAMTTNHSAEAVSITHPHAGAQRNNYRQVMHAAGISPAAVSYVELHGTGTQAGDSVESESVLNIFADPKLRRQSPLLLGAVKSNIGHGEAAAGIASLLKVLLIYQKNKIPPHIGIKTEMNPVVAKTLEKCKAALAQEMTPWERQNGKKRYALVNSFGAHGGNTTMLLEDAPDHVRVGVDPRPTHVVSLSAKSKASLKGNIQALIDHLASNPEIDLGDLAYTTTARRMQHHTRVAVAGSSIQQVKQSLEKILAADTVSTLRPMSNAPQTIPFTFTGQGAFYSGMGSNLYHEFPAFGLEVDELDRLVQYLGFPSVKGIIDGSLEDVKDVSPVVTQLAILISEVALVRFWAHLGVTPSAVIGHSLGEYAALVAAKVVSAADAIFLVGKRAELLLASSNIGSHVMLAVRAGVDQIKQLAPKGIPYEVSCINAPQSTVIGGAADQVQAVRKALEAEGVKCTPLDVPFAFHTAQLEPILDDFERLAQQVSFRTPSVPILSPLLADAVFDGKTVNSKYLRRASREPVNFVEALEAGLEMGVIQDNASFLEIGPHPVNGSFIRAAMPQSNILASLRKGENNFTTVANSLMNLQNDGLVINWNAYFLPFEKSHLLLSLPNYVWNEKNHWIQYNGNISILRASAEAKGPSNPSISATSGSALRSSSIHRILSEDTTETTASLTAITDMMEPEFLASVSGHFMNGHGIASLSIWGDVAQTVGEYLYKRLVPKAKEVPMDVSRLECFEAQVAHSDKSCAQLIQTEATLDLEKREMAIAWYNLTDEGRSHEEFAHATVLFTDPADWCREWDRVSHLVNSRIESLDRMAQEGKANRLNRNMAYQLFKNVVDYADVYRGMQSVVLNDNEAYADIILDNDRHGTWHTPPHWTDSLFHIGGFVLNGSDTSNTKDFFYVTPGWDNCRMSVPTVPGGKYRSYVRMTPAEDKDLWASGDVYVLQDNKVVGMLTDMKFRRVPRILMNRFFSPSDEVTMKGDIPTSVPSIAPKPATSVAHAPAAAPAPIHASAPELVKAATPASASAPGAPAAPAPSDPPAPPPPATGAKSSPATSNNPIINDALKIISRESGLDASELTDEASFIELGVDSLMSLVLSEKFKAELGLDVKSSVFIECPNIGELKAWLDQ